MIKENICLQYFVALKKFTTKPAFDAYLFVDLRKRLGVDKFDSMDVEIIKLTETMKKSPGSHPKNKGGGNADSNSEQTKTNQTTEKKITDHKKTLVK